MPFEMQNGGLDLWEYLKRKPHQDAQFSAAMTSLDVTGADVCKYGRERAILMDARHPRREAPPVIMPAASSLPPQASLTLNSCRFADHA